MTTPITARDVQELRQRTGAGMMDCKNALIETQGDQEKAVEYLRKKGIAKAEKRAGRVASEGRIVSLVSPDGNTGILLELNSETDFVARNEDFAAVAAALGEQLLQDTSFDGIVPVASEGQLPRQPWHRDPTKTVQDAVTETSARTGENIVLRRYARFSTDGTLGVYVHFNGRVAVMVDVGGPRGDAARELARRLAAHVAGSPRPPEAVRREDVSPELVERERRIAEEKARAEGKPDHIIPRVVEGTVRKYYEEVTLLEQRWVRDESRTIQHLVDEASRAAGGALTVRRFVRYRMGEE
jgi:elongation factor Ts